MPSASEIDLWIHLFPALKSLKDEHFLAARSNVRFPVLEQGAVAYRQGAECPSYVMCLEGGTRTYKISASGRELLIYRVTPGSTCVFTTQCLFAGGTFPAESVAESRTRLAALPAGTFHALMADSAEFRRLVLDDYANLLNRMISLVDEVAFSSLDERLARRLLGEADAAGIVAKTHQQLAADLGSVREVISRHLGEWERAGWIATARGSVRILDRPSLAAYRSSR